MSRPGPRRVALVFAVAAGMLSLWVLFVGSFQGQEIALGGVCTVAATAFVSFAWHAGPAHLQLRARDVAQGWRVPGEIAGSAVLVCKVLCRDLFTNNKADSILQVYSFEASETDPVKRAREVLAVTYMTASPNSIVLGVDEESRLLLVHQLAPEPLPELAKALGAGEGGAA